MFVWFGQTCVFVCCFCPKKLFMTSGQNSPAKLLKRRDKGTKLILEKVASCVGEVRHTSPKQNFGHFLFIRTSGLVNRTFNWYTYPQRTTHNLPFYDLLVQLISSPQSCHECSNPRNCIKNGISWNEKTNQAFFFPISPNAFET